MIEKTAQVDVMEVAWVVVKIPVRVLVLTHAQVVLNRVISAAQLVRTIAQTVAAEPAQVLVQVLDVHHAQTAVQKNAGDNVLVRVQVIAKGAVKMAANVEHVTVVAYV